MLPHSTATPLPPQSTNGRLAIDTLAAELRQSLPILGDSLALELALVVVMAWRRQGVTR
jgi:hypothetical protein